MSAMYTNTSVTTHCKLGNVESAYTECGNGAAAMQVSQVNLFELGPIELDQVQTRHNA